MAKFKRGELGGEGHRGPNRDSFDKALCLRRAREAAQKPQYTEGQEVWVRHVVAGTRAPVDDGGVDVKYPRGLSPSRTIFHAHHDDIRPVENEDE